MASESNTGSPDSSAGRKRTRMVRSYPTHTLEDALSVAVAIHESNAGLACDRKLLARALGTTPASSGYTMRLNSSAKYGLTQGGYSDAQISLTALGESIVAPRTRDELRGALREAALYPDVFGRLYKTLDGKRLPEDTFAENMLQREFGIHPDLAAECLSIVRANGLHVGILEEADGGVLLVALEHGPPGSAVIPDTFTERGEPAPSNDVLASHPSAAIQPLPGGIFVGHTGNSEALEIVQRTFDGFGIPYETATHGGNEDDHQPVSADVAKTMRRCTAAVLVLDARDQPDAAPPAPTMLYQLGAASALYGDSVVLFVQGAGAPAPDATSVGRVTFHQGRPDAAALDLLRQLHHAGVVKVTV